VPDVATPPANDNWLAHTVYRRGHPVRLGCAAWKGHDGEVTALIVVLLIGVLLAGVGARQADSGQSPGPRSVRPRPAKPTSIYWYVAAAVVAIVLVRFGLSRLAIAGGALVALLRAVAPLLRLVPLFQTLRDSGRAQPGRGQGGGGGRPESPRPERMTRQEALRVLGLDESATRDDVQREYRRLMRKIHPDLGGSSYLAAKINEAKDVLS
jgi:DnaJ-like protein